MKKKIGILTLPLNNNYGGMLQAFALYQFLKNQNHDAYLIQKEAYRPKWKRWTIGLLEKIPFQDLKKYRSTAIKNKYHRPFIDKYISEKTKAIYTTKELEAVSLEHDFDAVIVGSDQVWRLEYIDDGYFSSYFLDFIKPPKTLKISYAASFGKDTWEDTVKAPLVEELLHKFDAISTREISGVQVCAQQFKLNECAHVLDPTLMVDRSVYDCFLTPPSSSHNKTLLTYILDHNQNKNNILDDVTNNLPELHTLVQIYKNDQHTPQFTVAQWVNLFADADFIVTDSFHGMVFSIIFNKQFVVIGNNNRGLARFSSLLSMLGLESRLVIDNAEYDIPGLMQQKIDYTVIESVLSNLKRQSKYFLESSLLISEQKI